MESLVRSKFYGYSPLKNSNQTVYQPNRLPKSSIKFPISYRSPVSNYYIRFCINFLGHWNGDNHKKTHICFIEVSLDNLLLIGTNVVLIHPLINRQPMYQQLRDEELIHHYLNTNQNDYFETLYNRYVSKVYRRCLSLTKDDAKAQDFTHDIFLRVIASLGNFKERSAFSTWLYSISYNYCMDQRRLANRNVMVSIQDDIEYTVPDAEENEVVEYKLQHLKDVLSTISPDEIVFLRLKYEDGLDIKEIARQFNLKDSAVKMRLKRTRDKIRRLCIDQPY